MLVLSRKKNESIVIDGGIVIEILQISRDQIRVGVTAPAAVKVLRGELRPFSQQPVGQTQPLELDAQKSERTAQFAIGGNRLQPSLDLSAREIAVREPELVFQTGGKASTRRSQPNRPKAELTTSCLVRCG